MEDLQIFQNSEFGAIRTVTVDDEVWFVAKDVCKALNKSPLTIRKWEREGIIKPPSLRDSRNWRVYSRSEFADLLEDVLDYPWKNNVFDNPGQIQLLIIYLRMGESNQ